MLIDKDELKSVWGSVVNETKAKFRQEYENIIRDKFTEAALQGYIPLQIYLGNYTTSISKPQSYQEFDWAR